VTLAGTEGAKVKTSLAAMAATLRGHQLAAAETQAQAAQCAPIGPKTRDQGFLQDR
jgi:hypothetical protein